MDKSIGDPVFVVVNVSKGVISDIVIHLNELEAYQTQREWASKINPMDDDVTIHEVSIYIRSNVTA